MQSLSVDALARSPSTRTLGSLGALTTRQRLGDLQVALGRGQHGLGFDVSQLAAFAPVDPIASVSGAARSYFDSQTAESHDRVLRDDRRLSHDENEAARREAAHARDLVHASLGRIGQDAQTARSYLGAVRPLLVGRRYSSDYASAVGTLHQALGQALVTAAAGAASGDPELVLDQLAGSELVVAGIRDDALSLLQTLRADTWVADPSVRGLGAVDASQFAAPSFEAVDLAAPDASASDASSSLDKLASLTGASLPSPSQPAPAAPVILASPASPSPRSSTTAPAPSTAPTPSAPAPSPVANALKAVTGGGGSGGGISVTDPYSAFFNLLSNVLGTAASKIPEIITAASPKTQAQAQEAAQKLAQLQADTARIQAEAQVKEVEATASASSSTAKTVALVAAGVTGLALLGGLAYWVLK